jgi:hypothetical protein
LRARKLQLKNIAESGYKTRAAFLIHTGKGGVGLGLVLLGLDCWRDDIWGRQEATSRVRLCRTHTRADK